MTIGHGARIAPNALEGTGFTVLPSRLGRADLVALNPTTLLALRARLAWAHDSVSDPALAPVFQALPGTSFVVNGAAPATNSALAYAGAVASPCEWRFASWEIRRRVPRPFFHLCRNRHGPVCLVSCPAPSAAARGRPNGRGRPQVKKDGLRKSSREKVVSVDENCCVVYRYSPATAQQHLLVLGLQTLA